MPNGSLSLAEYPSEMVRIIAARLRPASLLVFVFCMSGEALPALATTWQEHNEAGLSAFDSGDYPQAVAQFEEAFFFAEEAGAADQDLGIILEHVATAYLANDQYQQAQETIAHWDSILAVNEEQAWVSEHWAIRDRLAALVFKLMGQAPNGNGASAAATPPPSGEDTLPQTPIETYAVHLASDRTEESAALIWENLKELYPSLLADKHLTLKQIDLGDRGVFFRVLAFPYESEASARSACVEFQKTDQYCIVISVEVVSLPGS